MLSATSLSRQLQFSAFCLSTPTPAEATIYTLLSCLVLASYSSLLPTRYGFAASVYNRKGSERHCYLSISVRRTQLFSSGLATPLEAVSMKLLGVDPKHMSPFDPHVAQ